MAKLWKEKSLFELNTELIHLQISFYLPDVTECFIIGLLNNQQVFIGDKFNGIDFSVAQTERLPTPAISASMSYSARSAVVASFMPENGKYAKYLSPKD